MILKIKETVKNDAFVFLLGPAIGMAVVSSLAAYATYSLFIQS
jgi:hypothetical protein